MSVILDKLTRTKQEPITVLLNIIKGIDGLYINIKSENLGKLVNEFYDRYYMQENKSFNYLPNPNTIIMSMKWTDYYSNRQLIIDNNINLYILQHFRLDKITEYTHKINNVFTNDEIQTYIKTFEAMIVKMKSMVKRKKRTLKAKHEDQNDMIIIDEQKPLLITSPSINNRVYGESVINEYRTRHESQTDIHDSANCQLCQTLGVNN